MSVSLDFSDMFRQQSTGTSANLSKRRDNEAFNASDLTRAFQFESINADENIPPDNLTSVSSRGDLRSWILTSLSALNISGLKDEDVTDAALPVLQKLINDRQYWQQQFQFVSEDSQGVRRRAEAGERTCTSLRTQIEALQQDVISVQNKMAATAEEQRKLRNHWLAEKNDLEKRCFQLQGLNTQYEGTMRKKDKEYDKLQIQLAKLVKDSQRGQKSVITLTKPLPKNLTDPSKIAPPAPTLKDMELAEAKATIANLEVENNNLRNMFNTLTQSFEEMQSSMIMTNLSGYMLPPEAPADAHHAVAPTPVERADAATDAMMPVVSSKTPSKPKATVPATPRGKPYHLIVKEAITCSKEMRSIALSPPHPSQSGHSSDAEDGSELVLSLQSCVEELMAKLFKAESLIKEQDGLIHAALVAKLPGLDASSVPYDPESQLDCEDSEGLALEPLGTAAQTQTPAPTEQWDVKDFLSPASPETLALLKASGAFWSPFISNSEK